MVLEVLYDGCFTVQRHALLEYSCKLIGITDSTIIHCSNALLKVKTTMVEGVIKMKEFVKRFIQVKSKQI